MKDWQDDPLYRLMSQITAEKRAEVERLGRWRRFRKKRYQRALDSWQDFVNLTNRYGAWLRNHEG